MEKGEEEVIDWEVEGRGRENIKDWFKVLNYFIFLS
jgi:hypothetical protein